MVIDAVGMRLPAAIEALATLDPSVRENRFGRDRPLMTESGRYAPAT
jgi:hypothetical protein